MSKLVSGAGKRLFSIHMYFHQQVKEPKISVIFRGTEKNQRSGGARLYRQCVFIFILRLGKTEKFVNNEQRTNYTIAEKTLTPEMMDPKNTY